MTTAIPRAVQIEAARRIVTEGRSPAPLSYVAYYRVSTDRQGESGLGLDAQRAAVARFIGSASLLAEFQEIESGKRHTNRPQLTAALECCRKNRATLVIAKLDRLARNVHFVTGLQESRVDFVCCDNPHANKAFIQMMAVFAEHEREMISQRTSAALHQVKRRLAEDGHRVSVRGRVYTRLGNPRWQDTIAKARAARNPFVVPTQVIQMMAERRAEGKTYRQIAADLNAMGLKATRGGVWHDTVVRRCLRSHMQEQQQ